MADGIEIKGLAELDAKLHGLEKDASWKILRNAGTQAMKPVLDDMKANAPRASTDKAVAQREKRGIKPLHEITKRWSERGDKKGNDDIGYVNVGYRSKAHWWARLLEEGTESIAPKGWIRRAMDSNVATVLDRFQRTLAKRIAKFEKTGK